jgi:hypothetical protein
VKRSEFERGVLVGLLIGEGSFGGDGRNPGVQLKMGIRHENFMRWVHSVCPGSKLYGPYDHGGREYFLLHIRGQALADLLIDVADEVTALDSHAGARLARMRELYGV